MCCQSRWTRSHDVVRKHQKSHRAFQQSKNMSGHRVTGCVTQTKNKKRLNPSSNCVTFILQPPRKKELEEELLQCQEKGTDVNARTAELNKETLTSQSSQSSTDRRDAKSAKDTKQKDSPSAHMESCCKHSQQKTQKYRNVQQRKS